VGKYVIFGHLQQRRLMADGRAFYCPAEVNPSFLWDTFENPWPRTVDIVPTKNVQVGYSVRPEMKIPDVLTPDLPLPHLTKFKNKAIVADTTSAMVRIETRHRIGLNALYGDGSAIWIPRKQITPAIDQLPEAAGAPRPEFDPLMDAVWAGLDKR
jgi:hypothetical protein